MEAKRARGQRLLYAGYAEVLKLVVDGSATWQSIAAALSLGRSGAQGLLNRMVDACLIHEAAWQPVHTYRTTYTPIYAFGEGTTLAWPGKGKRPMRRLRPAPVELLTFITAIKALQSDTYNAVRLAEQTGMGKRSAQRLLKKLHALRLIFIDEFEERPQGGHGYPLYAWGPNRADMTKPAPMDKRLLSTAWARVNYARQRDVRLLGLVNRSPEAVAA